MDYVRYIRNLVGHEPINLTGVNVVILNEKNEILLQKRKDIPVGKWGLVGGVANLGEALTDAAIREVKEETNLDISDPVLFGETSGEFTLLNFPNGDKSYFISIGYFTNNYSGELKINDGESLDLRFFSFSDLPDNMVEAHRLMINKYLDYIN